LIESNPSLDLVNVELSLSLDLINIDLSLSLDLINVESNISLDLVVEPSFHPSVSVDPISPSGENLPISNQDFNWI